MTDEALYDLFNESFKRWKEKGLEAPWLNVSFKKFSKQLNTSTVFVAVDANTDELLGLQCFRKNKKHRWAYDFYLALSLRHRDRALPQECWPTKPRSSNKQAISILKIIRQRRQSGAYVGI